MSNIGVKKSKKRVEISTKFTPRFLEDLDGRRSAVRELERRFHQLVADLGGTTYLSYQQTALARRAIHLEARLESLEAAFSEGMESSGNLMFYTTGSNALLGIFKALGIKKQAPEITLEQHLGGMRDDCA